MYEPEMASEYSLDIKSGKLEDTDVGVCCTTYTCTRRK